MSIDHGAPAAAGARGETSQALNALEARRFRGSQWLDADEVAGVVRSADERIALLTGELDRLRRENEMLAQQVELLRHGALPSAAPQGPDPMLVEMAVRAQEEANRTIGEASAEGAEIIADARRQAEEIVAEAHRRAGMVPAQAGPSGDELRQQVRELESRYAALQAAVATAQQHLSQWQAHLAAQAEQLRADSVAAGAASDQLRQLTGR
jgi:cell division septum initiation protein DivIVA